MNAEMNRDLPTVSVAVQSLVKEFGLVRVTLALAGLAVSPGRRARVWDQDLPDHLRRDIGLWPVPPTRNYWDL
ncbi:MAG: hypothetical protein KDE00_13840 [Rhodobacteraceae bacterium]|nr:hypothetical protein [Paracoccaceae bacterium]